jgi:hypothetical protein
MASQGSKAGVKAAPDSRYRPFRIGAYTLYLVIVSAVSLLVIKGVVTSVARMTPGRKPAAEQTLTVATTFPAARTDQTWEQFRVGWIERYRDAESRCALESHSRGSLREVYGRLSRVMDLFTTSAVQYAGEAGGAVDALREAFTAARKEPAAGKLP